MLFLGHKVGTFEGVTVYESPQMGQGYNSAGLALPGYGIIVGVGVFSKNKDLFTVMHEFGHILQAQQVGWFMFYLFIGLPSLLSAWLNWHGQGHGHYWTETWCNHLAKIHFNDVTWPDKRFPAKKLSQLTSYWLVRI